MIMIKIYASIFIKGTNKIVREEANDNAMEVDNFGTIQKIDTNYK